MRSGVRIGSGRDNRHAGGGKVTSDRHFAGQDVPAVGRVVAGEQGGDARHDRGGGQVDDQIAPIRQDPRRGAADPEARRGCDDLPDPLRTDQGPGRVVSPGSVSCFAVHVQIRDLASPNVPAAYKRNSW